MIVDLSTTGGLLVSVLPEMWLTVWTLVLLFVVAWRHDTEAHQRLAGHFSLLGLASTLLLVIWMWVRGASVNGLQGMMALDDFRYATASIFLMGAVGAVMISLRYMSRERILMPEYYVLVLLATIGMMFMGGGGDLIVIFLGLELMSISVYVLAGIDRRSAIGAEAALKYFLLGAFASGFFLYGIALLYGASGTTNLALLHVQITTLGLETNAMLLVGTALLLVGFGFKIAAVPFHMWAPDVYDGAPTPVTAYMAAAVKAAGFAALIRVLFNGLSASGIVWQEAVLWLAIVTMLVGNVVALAQTTVKRMLAYSSIGHAGYLLVAVNSGSERGAAAFLFYAFVYTLMTMGAFAILGTMGRDGERDVKIDDLSGLSARRPWVALAMAVFMLSLLGFPGTAGFIGKWFILSAAIEASQGLLAVLLVIASVVSAGYYLPVIMAMYMKAPVSADAHDITRVLGPTRWVVAAATAALLLFGVWPNRVLDAAERSAEGMLPPASRVLTD